MKRTIKRGLTALQRQVATLRGAAGGWTRYCPVCDQRVPGFKSLAEANPILFDQWQRGGFDLGRLRYFETLNEQEFQCPAHGCGDRERLYALYVLEQLARTTDRRKLRMVDFAPSHNFLAFIHRQGRFEYRRADLFREDVDDRIDLQDMHQYGAESFDCFICSHILEHVPDDRRAMSELFRILKPDGWGIVMVPILTDLETTDEDPTLADSLERIRRFGQDDHIRQYARRDLLSRLEAAGFEVAQLREEHFGRATFIRCGISANSVLYVVTKPA